MNGISKILVLLTFLVIQFSAAQESSTTNTILFKIEKPNSDYTSYLFGTHHAFGKTFFDSLTNANKSLRNCNVLIKENLNIPGQMAEDIINRRTKQTKWNKYLSKDNLAYIENLFASSPTDFKKMTPPEMYAFLNRYYKAQFCLAKDSTDTSNSLDDYIGLKAEQLNIKLVGLETTEEQIALLNKDIEGMPRKVHKKRFANLIKRIKAGQPTDCEETDWYEQMDIEYQLNERCQNALILTDRNNKWMKVISQQLELNNCFIAVGLSHLMFECGLINQLQKLGYTITPFKAK
ncbi:TraB/GumN family protein [Winogradskyella pulchriflava]|uniref:TraB/GumN family protein n=1 Tax=Winogradskyella pulchriflava TaxID=1110688 RepID=A0ABV6Q3W5_9FLAO